MHARQNSKVVSEISPHSDVDIQYSLETVNLTYFISLIFLTNMEQLIWRKKIYYLSVQHSNINAWVPEIDSCGQRSEIWSYIWSTREIMYSIACWNIEGTCIKEIDIHPTITGTSGVPARMQKWENGISEDPRWKECLC